jgi:acetyl esterase/lipase
MRIYLVVLTALVTALSANAQITTGITGKKDTSFNNYTAYTSTKKQFSYIQMVQDVPSPDVKEERDLTYCSTTNGPLHLDIFTPKKLNNSKIPTVIIVHGGGWRTGDRSQHIPLARELAKAGYVAITIEYRLSTIALYPAALQDVKAAIRWAKANASKYKIDKDKLAILGFSAGGELAAFTGITNSIAKFDGSGCNDAQSSTVQAIVDIDGILSFTHPESGEGDDSRSTSAATYWFGYGKKDKPELWREASSLTYAENAKIPILFLNSSANRMHAGRDDLIKIMQQKNIYTEVHTFAGAPHTFCLFEPWFTPTIKYTVDFLNKTIK